MAKKLVRLEYDSGNCILMEFIDCENRISWDNDKSFQAVRSSDLGGNGVQIRLKISYYLTFHQHRIYYNILIEAWISAIKIGEN